MTEAEPLTTITELPSRPPDSVVRMNVVLLEWQLESDSGTGLIADESGQCELVLNFQTNPGLREVADGLHEGFVLGMRARSCAGGKVELEKPEDLLRIEVILRPEHDLRPFIGKRVTISGGLVRIGWLPERGAGMFLLSDGGPGAWVYFRYLQDPGLLDFARWADGVSFLGVHGTVVQVDLPLDEGVYPPRFALFRSLLDQVHFTAVEIESADQIVAVEPMIRPPRYLTNCSLGQQMGCQILCCTRQVRLTDEDMAQGLRYTELPGEIHYLLKEEDGYCYAMDRETGRCGVYDQRPQACRDFSCIHEPSILQQMSRMGPIERMPLFVQIDP